MSPVVGDQDREDMSLIVVIPARITMNPAGADGDVIVFPSLHA